jgi:hypothetical protein
MSRRPALTLDSPLRAPQDASEATAPSPSSPSAEQNEPPQVAVGEWREWGARTSTRTYRHPVELIDELEHRAERLGASVSTIATAAITGLLDLTDEELTAAVERAERAISRGKRKARARAR